MLRNFNFRERLGLARAAGPRRDPRALVKGVLGALTFANIIAALFWIGPFGSSPEQLESELSTLRVQLQSQQAALTRLRSLAQKIESARSQQEEFVKTWFIERRTASSAILSELENAAKQSGLRPRDHSFVIEPVDGTDWISMMTITANYEGAYSDLIEFVHFIDRSGRFLILDSITASPQQNTGLLNTRFRIHTFVRHTPEEGRLLSTIAPVPEDSTQESGEVPQQ